MKRDLNSEQVDITTGFGCGLHLTSVYQNIYTEFQSDFRQLCILSKREKEYVGIWDKISHWCPSLNREWGG